ncbi:MAG: DUF3943 domain-containing protein [Methylotenera sp.]
MKKLIVTCVLFTACAAITDIAFADGLVEIAKPVASLELVEVALPLPHNPTKVERLSDRVANKSYLIPVAEIIGFDFLLNQFNRRYSGSSDYDSNFSTIRHNLNSSWKDDRDPFNINQLGHPYQGSMYHGFARSAGLNYWESLGYTLAGSAFWEIAGEKVPPSKNDMLSTGFGGSFLGEALFRMSNLVLEKGGSSPSFWRETGAAIISPSAGFNRYALGDRFDAVFASNDAAYYSRLQFGISNTIHGDLSTTAEIKRNDAQLDFLMGYGLPGKPGYAYTRPFDYFVFQSTASSANIFESVMTRGLLFGRDYQVGENYRGLWGLYGSYDYISPQTFRISSTALSLGTTGQLWLSESVALQGTVMGGVGYAAVGTNNGKTAQDYHYGVAPQGLAALRVIFGKKASVDFTGREYFVSDVDNIHKGGHDNIVRADVAFTYRVYRKHAVTIKYQWNQRDATFPDIGDKKQATGTLGIFYTFLGHDGFGEIDWR